MKKMILVVMAMVMVMMSACGHAQTAEVEHEYYARGAVVVELDRENNVVTIEDCTGFTEEFTECADWCLGDGCVMVMDTMGPDEIFDDEIINVRYERINLLNELAEAYEE